MTTTSRTIDVRFVLDSAYSQDGKFVFFLDAVYHHSVMILGYFIRVIKLKKANKPAYATGIDVVFSPFNGTLLEDGIKLIELLTWWVPFNLRTRGTISMSFPVHVNWR